MAIIWNIAINCHVQRKFQEQQIRIVWIPILRDLLKHMAEHHMHNAYIFAHAVR